MSMWSSLGEEFHLPRAGRKIAIGIAAFAIYLSVAFWLKYSYVPPASPPGTVLELKRPFDRFSFAGHVASYTPVLSLDGEADTNDSARSPYIVYEDSRPLGPAHALHPEISDLGHGRFSHWKGVGFIISSSDGTSPASNGRRYRVVLPP
jgi:hypothetical protein